MKLHVVVGQNIRSFRKEKGWSQEKLAWTAGLSSNYLSSLERGNVNISVDALERIAQSLEVEAKQLLKSNSKY